MNGGVVRARQPDAEGYVQHDGVKIGYEVFGDGTPAVLLPAWTIVHSRRPFIYLPLRQHFEQAFHVHHRLQAHRAGRRMDFGQAQPDALAEAITRQLACPADYRPVERDGAARAAAAIAGLL